MTGEELLAYIQKIKQQGKATGHTKTKTTDAATGKYSGGKYGLISGYFATWDRVADSYGDVIKRGAFLDSIASRKATGHDFPFLYNHDFNQIIGRVTDIGEDSKGAYFTAEFFPTDRAQEIREIARTSVLWQFSFAYSTIDEGRVTLPDGSRANELRKLDLYEVSLVGIPANSFTHVTDLKGNARDLKRLRDKEAQLMIEYANGGSCQGAKSERYYESELQRVRAEIQRLRIKSK